MDSGWASWRIARGLRAVARAARVTVREICWGTCRGGVRRWRVRPQHLVTLSGIVTVLLVLSLPDSRFGLAFVAAGRVDGYWERGLAPWDLAAGVVLVVEAGGVVSAYDGGPMAMADGRVIACTPGLHQPLIDGLARCRPLSGASFGAPELDAAGEGGSGAP